MSSLATSSGSLIHVDRYRAVANDRERQHCERPLAVERDHAGGAVDERWADVGAKRRALIAPRATRAAPCSSIGSPSRRWARRTTSGSSIATSASSSPSRAAAKYASTTACCRVRSGSGAGAAGHTG